MNESNFQETFSITPEQFMEMKEAHEAKVDRLSGKKKTRKKTNLTPKKKKRK